MNIKRLFTFKKTFLIAVIVVFVIISVFVYVHLPTQATHFRDAFIAYETNAIQQDQAAYYPATNENPTRQELNQLLSEILVGNLSPSERLSRAERGLMLLIEAEKQIDAMGDLSMPVNESLQALRENSGVLETPQTNATITSLAELAEHRLSIIQDIRGLSYSTNFYTEEIFKRIIEDEGVLTPEHSTFLNEQVPLLEEKFDARASLYSELEETRFAIERLATRFDE